MFKKKNTENKCKKAQTKKLYAGNRVKKKDREKVKKERQERSGKKNKTHIEHTPTQRRT